MIWSIKKLKGYCFNNGPINFQVYLAASLSGLGGVFGPLVYALPVGTKFQHLHITQLEMLMWLLSLKSGLNFGQIKKSKFSVTIEL